MTVAEAIRDGAKRLSTASDTSRLDAEVLMAHALGVNRSQMLIRQMGEPAPAGFSRLIGRREQHEPVAYITGFQEFYGRPFKVTRDTLIPRPDSETVVEAALEVLGDTACPGETILDLGTGSGALLLSVLAQRPNLRGYGIDISGPAIAVAKANAKQLGLDDRACFGEVSWTQEGFQHCPHWPKTSGLYDLVIANPPYVERTAQLDPQVQQFEPHSALFAGPDGLDDYREIIPDLTSYLADSGAAILEIGATQAEPVTMLAKQQGFSVELRYDLANRPRAAVLRQRK